MTLWDCGCWKGICEDLRAQVDARRRLEQREPAPQNRMNQAVARAKVVISLLFGICIAVSTL